LRIFTRGEESVKLKEECKQLLDYLEESGSEGESDTDDDGHDME